MTLEQARRARLNLDDVTYGPLPDLGTPAPQVSGTGDREDAFPRPRTGTPPNLREVPTQTGNTETDIAGAERCGTCSWFDKGARCVLYDYPVGPLMVCDDYQSIVGIGGGGTLQLDDTTAEKNAEFKSGAMVALYPPDEVKQALVAAGATMPPEEMHLTLAFLGDSEDVKYRETLGLLIEEVAMRTRPIKATLSGIATFNGGNDGDVCTVALVDSAQLTAMRGNLVRDLHWKGASPSMKHGFTPHITLVHGEKLDADIPPLEFEFDALSLVLGEERRDVPFNPEAEEGFGVDGIYLADEVEVFTPGNVASAVELDDGLIWKEALREGSFVPVALPDPSGEVKIVDMRVVDGRSPDPSVAIGLDDIIDAHNEGLYDHVTVPLSHKDRPHENTGFVERVRKTTRDGINVLQAGARFTKKAIEESVRDGSIANVSCGLRFFQQHHETKKVYPTSMAHLALTNKPWVPGMRPFSATLSDDACILSLQLADDTPDEGGDHMGEQTVTPPEESADVKQLRLDLEREREANAALRAQTDKLLKKDHVRDVEADVATMVGQKLPTAFTKTARELMLADDGGPVLKLDLSDEGGAKESELGVRDIVKRLAGTLVDKDTGKFAAQHADELHLSDEQRPDDKHKPEEKPVKDRADALEAELGGV